MPKIDVAGIYVHIPFCRQACHYCDFHFSTDRSPQSRMIAAIGMELLLQRHYLQDDPVHTLYFGGGTPSLLQTAEVSSLLAAVAGHYPLDPAAEITLEANPDDLTEPVVSGLRQSGVNRLSIGIQSFDDGVLKLLNRCHDAGTALDSYARARRAGFDNISVDLIYAIPGLGIRDWEDNIRQAIAMAPEHISAYTLTIEPRTVFGRLAARGKFSGVDEDAAAIQMELLVDLLGAAGYEQYEVSNFAKPGRQSKHNTSYWQQRHYLGVGPGAHSYNGVSRQSNISNNYAYMQSLEGGHVPFQMEMLSRFDQINEYLLTSLRMARGCDLAALKLTYDFDLLADKPRYVDQLIRNGMAVLGDSSLQLTRKGRLLADKIAADLFVAPPSDDDN